RTRTRRQARTTKRRRACPSNELQPVLGSGETTNSKTLRRLLTGAPPALPDKNAASGSGAHVWPVGGAMRRTATIRGRRGLLQKNPYGVSVRTRKRSYPVMPNLPSRRNTRPAGTPGTAGVQQGRPPLRAGHLLGPPA